MSTHNKTIYIMLASDLYQLEFDLVSASNNKFT